MRVQTDRLLGSLSQGWGQLAVYFLLLLLGSLILSWLANRKLRPVDRGPALSLPMFIASFAMLMIARHFILDRWNAVIIAAGLAVAGLFISKSGTRAPVLIVLMLALLLGFGLNLSALVLFIAAFTMLLLSRTAVK